MAGLSSFFKSLWESLTGSRKESPQDPPAQNHSGTETLNAYSEEALDDTLPLSFEEEMEVEKAHIKSIAERVLTPTEFDTTTRDLSNEGSLETVIETDENAHFLTGPMIFIPQKKKLQIDEIRQERLAESMYYPEKTEKKQVFIHHTVSSGNPMSAINWWRKDGKRVGTFLVIAGRTNSDQSPYKDGEVFQCYSSLHWAHHLYTPSKGNKVDSKYKTHAHNKMLNKQGLGIELSSWGPAKLMSDGRFVPLAHFQGLRALSKYNHLSDEQLPFKVILPEANVIEYPDKYRGYRYFEKYTDAQIESTRQVLVYLHETYDIPKTYQEGLFDILEKALKGEPGIYTHTSVRSDKSDCHPQPELINMLQAL